MEIHVYTKGDDQAVVDLWQESLAGMTDIVDERIDIKQRLSTPSQFFFVASVEGKVVGTALAGINDGVAKLDHLAVMPDLRRQKIGTALLREAETRLADAGCSALMICIDSANESALTFLSQVGYKLEGFVNLGKPLSTKTGKL